MSQYGLDIDLQIFVESFIASIENKDWENVLTFFAEDNRRAQENMGICPEQYFLEGIMIPVDPFLNSKGFIELNRLKTLKVDNIALAVEHCYAEVSGIAVLIDGQEFPFCLIISRYSDGRFIIRPPVG